MASSHGAERGPLALIASSCSSVESLARFTRLIKPAPSSLRALQRELELLPPVLISLKPFIETEGAGFAGLRLPLARCSKVCHDFEDLLRTYCKNSNHAETRLQSWDTVRYLGYDMNAFKDLIATYRNTFELVLWLFKTRRSAAPCENLDESSDLLAQTRLDLEVRFDGIRRNLQSGDHRNADPVVGQEMREEQKSIESCLELCRHVSEQAAKLGQRIPATQSTAMKSPEMLDWIKAAEDVVSLKAGLEQQLQRVATRLRQAEKSSGSHGGDKAAELALRQEVQTLERCIADCRTAATEAESKKSNVVEDSNVANDAFQLIVSSVGHLIFARRVSTAEGSVHTYGQMSDENIASIVALKEGSARLGNSRGMHSTNDGEFSQRYGAGRNLQTTIRS